jgi:hypothetical protein
VTNVNRELEARGLPPITLSSETVDGKTYYAITSGADTSVTGASFPELHYTSWMGYMIFAPSRALVADAIRIHDSGVSISRSAAFRSHIPADGRDTASAIMYQNLEAMTSGVSNLASDIITKDARESLREVSVLQATLPKLVFVYGEQDRILGSAKGSFGIKLASMLGASHLMEAAGMREWWLH